MDVTHYSFYVDEDDDEISINVEKLKSCGVPCIARAGPHRGHVGLGFSDKEDSVRSGVEEPNDASREEESPVDVEAADAVARLVTVFNETCTLTTHCKETAPVSVEESEGDKNRDLRTDRNACTRVETDEEQGLGEDTSEIGKTKNGETGGAYSPAEFNTETRACGENELSEARGTTESAATGLVSREAEDPPVGAKTAAEQGCQTSFCLPPSNWKSFRGPTAPLGESPETMPVKTGTDKAKASAVNATTPLKSRVPVRSAKSKATLFGTPVGESGTWTPLGKGRSPSAKKPRALSPWTVQSPVAKYIYENPVPPLVQAVKPQKKVSAKALRGIQVRAVPEIGCPASPASFPISEKKYQSSNRGLPLKVAPNRFSPAKPFVMKHTASSARSASTKDVDASVVHVLPARRIHLH